MLRNYLKIALRNLRKHKGHAALNITGLAIGMACGILIFLSVRQDLSYDRFHAHSDRIFRVLTIDRALGVSSQRVGVTLPALGPAMAADMPEVEHAVRLLGGGRRLLSYGDKDLYAENVRATEPSFFDVFSFPLLQGDPEAVLRVPGTLVLTETTARNLFGGEDPIGKTVRLDGAEDFTVTGVMADAPATSHLAFDVLTALVPREDQENFRQFLASWNSISTATYVLLKDPAAAGTLAPKLEAMLRSNDVGDNFSVTLQPLEEAHLYSANILYDNNAGKSDAGYVYGLAAVAVFVLLIAAFNFMNLATARSAERAKEVGVRKVVGARQPQLIAQHLGESVLLCLIAFGLALVVAGLCLPFVNEALGKQLALDFGSDPALFAWLGGLALLIALLAGSYPAFVLAGFKPITVLKGTYGRGRQGSLLRRVLVVTQFTASIVMIAGSLIVAQQLGFIREKNMGYDRDQVLVLELGSQGLQERAEALEEELLRHPSIGLAARSGGLPGRTLSRVGVQPEGASEDDNWIMSALSIDEHFLATLGIELAAGRNFSPEYGTDGESALLLNEAAVRALGWKDALGKTLAGGEQPRKVVGVVRDFHFASVRHQIEPLIMVYGLGPQPLLSLKVAAEDLPTTLAFVEATWRRFNPDHPFEYSFLDEEFEQQYRDEANFALLARGFTVLSILIACLGLFGLASFTAERRTKEIGVRKVLGASVAGIVLLLSREFARLVVVALIVAAPIAYLVMNRWLEDFAYRITLGPGIFLLAGALALAVALLTVSYQAARAAVTDPVKALRYE